TPSLEETSIRILTEVASFVKSVGVLMSMTRVTARMERVEPATLLPSHTSVSPDPEPSATSRHQGWDQGFGLEPRVRHHRCECELEDSFRCSSPIRLDDGVQRTGRGHPDGR